MRLIAASIRNPIAVAVTVALICLFGALRLSKLPLQLFPDIDRPNISIFTGWRAASPEEAEAAAPRTAGAGAAGPARRRGNRRQRELRAAASSTCTFSIGTDMNAALVDVIGRMNRIRPLPQDAERPVIQIGGGGNDSNDSLSWFFVQLLPGTKGPIENYRRYIEDVIKPRIESVPGVASVNVNAGPPDDVRITVDLAKAAAMGIAIPDIAQQRGRADRRVRRPGRSRPPPVPLRFTGRYKPEDLAGARARLARGPAGQARRCRDDREASRPISSSSSTRTAIPRSACRCCARPARTCSARSSRSRRSSRNCATVR